MLYGIRTLALLLIVLLAGCQSSQVARLYEGPERAAGDVVVVQVPETLEIISINGQRPAGVTNRIISGDRTLHLVPGSYEIIVFYKDIWTPLGATTHEVLRSKPVVYDIDGRAGESFQLAYEKPETYEAARELASDFSGWSLNSASGKRTATRPSNVSRPGLFSGIAGDGVEQVSHVTPAGAAAAVEPAADAKPVVTTPVPTNKATNDSAYLDMLKAYWSQASQEERRAFLRWIAE